MVLTTIILNSPPTADAGGPYALFEGDILTLDGSNSDDADDDSLTYAWDINGDGVFTDAAGESPTLTWAQLNGLGIVDGPATRNVRVQVSDGIADPVTSDAVVLTINNKVPTPTIHGAPPTSSEGTTINLTASAGDPSLQDMTAGFTFIWHVAASNGQIIADGSGSNFGFTPNDNGTYVVTLTATDKDNGSANTTATIEITNVDPTVTFSGPGSGVRGQDRSFSGSFSDPGSADTWTATVNFGDGSGDQPLTLNADKTFSFHHTYVNVGTYTITVTVRDDDGGIGTASRQIAISVVELQVNPCDPDTTDLVVGGTTGDDTISFAPVGNTGAVEVMLNGVSLGAYSPTGTIVAFAQAGNDDMQVAGSVSRSAWLDGGAGADRLKGGGSHDVLVGGDGDDLLVGGQGRDLLIGGFGSDRIVGNADEDILVAGTFTGENDHEVAAAPSWTNGRERISSSPSGSNT